MSIVHDVLKIIVDFVISPIGQLAIWGVLTSWVFAYTLVRLLSVTTRNDSRSWRCIAAGIMTVFWCCNATAWCLGYMGIVVKAVRFLYLSDLFFALCSVYIWKQLKNRWTAALVILYSISFLLSVLTWFGLDQTLYAVMSNIAYGLQLYVVSGWRPFRSRKKATC